MSLESVKAFFAAHAPELEVLVLPVSTATVEEAARGHGVSPGQIAKTISVRVGTRVVLVVTRGDRRLDNKKMKAFFGGKASFLGPEEVAEITGHPVGGVCPFGLKTPLEVFMDVSLQAWDIVVPAAGSTNSAVKIAPARMAALSAAQWADLCGEPQQAPAGDQQATPA